MKPFRLFVAGTDTGIGKTETACAVLSLLADAGRRPMPFKPYESGCADLRQPADALALRLAARSEDDLSRICLHRFKAPLAPGIATLTSQRSIPDYPLLLAASLLAMAPVLILFLLMQRRVIDGIAFSGMK